MEYQGKTIKLRTDGRYWVRYRKNGKQYSVYGKTEKECLNNLKTELKRKTKKYTRPPQEKCDFDFYQWLEFWNLTYKKPINRADNITRVIKNHIIGKLENKKLNKITEIELQQFINQIPPKRIKEEICHIISGSFNKAYKSGVIKNNPALGLTLYKHKREKGLALTPDEEKKFLDSIKNTDMEKYYLFCLYSGCRRNEALNVNIKDVDFDKKTIKIFGTKTATSLRTIPLFNVLQEIIKKTPKSKKGYLFDFKPEQATTEFKKHCPNHKLHDLRHTFATRCLEQGVSMKTLQAWLGHADYETTANVYTDVQYEYQQKQAQKVNALFDTHFDTQK